MRVLVIGGTSFFGAEIVRLLLASRHDVSVFTRGNAQPAWFSDVQSIQGDRFDAADFQDKLRDEEFDIVIDNIAFKAEDVERAVEIFEGRVGRYILTSTGSVYMYSPDSSVPLEEDSVDFDWHPPTFDPDHYAWQYAFGKVAAERVLMEQMSVPYTIIRPPMVLGPHDSTLRGYFYFQRLLDGKPLILTNSGINAFRLVFSRDLAGAYLLAMDNPNAVGVAYNVVQSEIVTLKDLVNTAAEALGIEPNIVNVPQDVMQERELEYADPYGGMINFVMSVHRAQADLGYQSTPFKTWITETALWYRDVYAGDDSPGYHHRGEEIAFARWYKSRLEDEK